MDRPTLTPPACKNGPVQCCVHIDCIDANSTMPLHAPQQTMDELTPRNVIVKCKCRLPVITKSNICDDNSTMPRHAPRANTWERSDNLVTAVPFQF